MKLVEAKLREILVESNALSSDDFDNCVRQSKNENRPLEYVIVDNDLISDENLGRLVANYFETPFVYLPRVAISEKVLNIVPEVVARNQKIISFRMDKLGLHLAMAEPNNLVIKEFVQKKVGVPIIAYYATDRDIENSLNKYSDDVNNAFKKIISESVKKAKTGEKAELPIVQIVEKIIEYSYQNKASDIHIEPMRDFSLVRFRIDGVLHDVVKLPLDIHDSIVTRIKVMAKIRTDEHQAAQDGKIQTEVEKRIVDIRVSVVPITGGEKVVMRLLSEKSRNYSFEDLGFQDSDVKIVNEAYKRPHGMILATGPTGSGKTTTLYAILKQVNKREVNVMTIEDPVEYDMPGVNQIQVNEKTELTFSKGLRSIVRQDPDIILVGEIRDADTAGIAINAGMTGHLVLSTMHTNDSATAIPRLFDMGVEPFLVASTVNVVIAQRLVRKICLVCRHSYSEDAINVTSKFGESLTKEHFGDDQKIRLYKGKGCEVCHDTGYDGRIGIYEVMLIDDDIRNAIIDRKSAATIKEISVKNGMHTMLEDGLEKIKQGLTTVEEVLRVTRQ